MSKPQGILRPLGLALVLAIGFGAVFALVGGWGISIWDSLQQRNRVNESLVVRWDGTPLIERYPYNDYGSRTYRKLVDDSEVPPSKVDERWLAGGILLTPRPGESVFPLFPSPPIGRFSDGQTPPKLWYFLDDGARHGRGYFVGYDSQSKLRVGFIGRNGFRPDQPPAEDWFPMDGAILASGMAFARRNVMSSYYYAYIYEDSREFPAWKVDMISGTQLLEVDLRSGVVTALMESPDLIAVGIVETASESKAAEEESPPVHRHQSLIVRTTDRVLVFNAPGKQQAAYSLPEGLGERDITFYEIGAGRALVSAYRVLPDHKSRVEVSWIDASGKVSQQAEGTLGKGNPRYEENEAWTAALIVPAPLALAIAAMLGPPFDHLRNGWAPNYSTALCRS